MSEHKSNMSECINMSVRTKATRSSPITTREKTAVRPFQRPRHLSQTEVTKLDAAIPKNLEDFGFMKPSFGKGAGGCYSKRSVEYGVPALL